jgi:antirestriction protein
MKVCSFANRSDCLKVSEQLFNITNDGNLLFFDILNLQAVELAISLANLTYEVEIFNTSCKLPFVPLDLDEDAPKIYVSCLSAYSNGFLHGMWIDANQEKDEIMKAINYMLSWSPMVDFEACEEWAIHSYENFEGITIGEYESIDRVIELAEKLEEHGEAFAAYLDHYNLQDINDFEERYQGCYKSEKDFAESYYDDAGWMQEIEKIGLQLYYIDFEAIARDMFTGAYTAIEKGYRNCYVFANG